MIKFAEGTLGLLAVISALFGFGNAAFGSSATASILSAICWLQFIVAIAALGILAAIQAPQRRPERQDKQPAADSVRAPRSAPVRPGETMPLPVNKMPPPK